jgi:hypothetical protein
LRKKLREDKKDHAVKEEERTRAKNFAFPMAKGLTAKEAVLIAFIILGIITKGEIHGHG